MAIGGSKRVPRKNIKELGGRPLIAWTIEAAKNAKSLDYFLVSTNDEEIAKISRALEAHVPFKRPDDLGEDVDSIYPTIHAIQKYEAYLDTKRWDAPLSKNFQHKIGYVVILQPTSPFRTSDDIDQCVQIAKTTGVDTVVSVTKVQQHPYWMFTMKAFGHELESFMNIELKGDVLVSQNLPVVFYPNGAVYVVRRDVAMDKRIYGDRIYGYMMPSLRSIDLETEEDFLYANAVLPILKEKEPYAKVTWVIS